MYVFVYIICIYVYVTRYVCIYVCMHVCNKWNVSLVYFPQGIHLINQPNKAGLAPLHLSTKNGHTPVTEVLLSHGADKNLTTSSGQTCLHLAAASCNDPESKVEMTPDLSKVHGLYH